jgi:hypothetical protein
MNSTRIWLVLVLLFCLAAWSYAQQSGQQSDPSHQEETRHPSEAPPPPHSPEVNPPRQEHPQQQEEKPPKAEKQEAPKPSKEQAKPNREEPNQTSRQGKVKVSGKSARIPDPQFKADFGRQHTFTVNRVTTETTIVPRQTQFVLAGYTFVFLDPWPAEWLLTDDCYIDFVDNEYFLFDAFHPGIRVALFVVG